MESLGGIKDSNVDDKTLAARSIQKIETSRNILNGSNICLMAIVAISVALLCYVIFVEMPNQQKEVQDTIRKGVAALEDTIRTSNDDFLKEVQNMIKEMRKIGKK